MTVKNTIKLLIISSLAVFGIGMFVPNMAMADTKNDILNSVNSTDPGSPTVDNAVSAAITVFTIIVGIAAVVMMILGGYKYITSAGDASKVAQAKATVLYALIGVALVVVSQVLLRFVIAKSRGL